MGDPFHTRTTSRYNFSTTFYTHICAATPGHPTSLFYYPFEELMKSKYISERQARKIIGATL